MKKYYGQNLNVLLPNPNLDGPLAGMVIPVPELTAAQAADLDIWSVPRGVPITITDVPVAGYLILIRTSSALRFKWEAAGLPVPTTAVDLRRVAEAALYGATTARRQSGVKVAGYRSTRVVVIWQPLCRSGRDAMERLIAEAAALWNEARKLCVDAGTVIAEPAVAALGAQ